MEITKTGEAPKLTIAVSGRLDTTTAPELEKVFKSSLEGISDLTVDITNLEYISSAGLRTLLAAQKTMAKQGKMVVTGVQDAVMEVFEVTGFSSVLTIE